MSIVTNNLDASFGVEILGVDPRISLSSGQVAEIDRIMDENGIALIRNVAMSAEMQLAFSRQFGPLDIGFKKVIGKNARVTQLEVGDISNLSPDGAVAKRSDRRIVSNIANQMWHSDSSFQRPAAKYSMLHSVTVPSWGGETEYCDLAGAYDALDDRWKARLEGLEAEHYALHSRFLLGDDGYTEAQKSAIEPVYWPIVRANPATGRKHLFIGCHARAIKGMSVPEGRMMLTELMEHATQPRFRYSHRWTPGDLMIWDNRATLHRGRPFDLGEARELRRTTTLDDHAPELAMVV